MQRRRKSPRRVLKKKVQRFRKTIKEAVQVRQGKKRRELINFPEEADR